MAQLSICTNDTTPLSKKSHTQFIQGDMFTANISQATVLALFLLPSNLTRLSPRFLEELRPGTRIVVNTFGIDGWEAAANEVAQGECGAWCNIMLYIIPAKVAGTWRTAEGELRLEQKAQWLTGTLRSGDSIRHIELGRVHGEQVSFRLGGVEHSAMLKGNMLAGNMKGRNPGTWTATRLP